jgi:hypothetical protein
MATIDDVYALLQNVDTKVTNLAYAVDDVRSLGESTVAMLAALAPFFASGAKFYVDGVNGSDAYDGSSGSPFATIGKALTMCLAGRHDVIIVLQMATAYAEQVAMDKEAVLLLGSGARCTIDPGAAATDDTINITAANCAILGFSNIKGRNGHRAIYAYNADYPVIQRSICQTDGTNDIDAVVIEECLLPVLGPELSCSHADGHGLVIKSTTKACHWARVTDITAHQCGKDGIHIEGNVDRAIVRDCNVHDNAGYGINVGGSHNIIDSSNRVHDNTTGDIYDTTGLNKIYDNGTDSLALITGVRDLGVAALTEFKPVSMEQGEKRIIVYEMTEDDVPVDCTGFSFQLGVKELAADTAYKIGLISGVVSLGSTGLQSLITFTFTPAMTQALAPFIGVYSVALYDLSANKVPLTQPGGVIFRLKQALIP